MRLFSLAAVGLAWQTLEVGAKSAFGNKVLVVLDKQVEESAFSGLWQSLRARQFELSFRQTPSSQPSLFEFGAPSFDHVILFAPSAKGSDLSPQSLFSFISDESGNYPRNLLIALNESCSESWKDFAREFSIEFDAKNTHLVDHFDFEQSLDVGLHSTVSIKDGATLPASFGQIPRENKPILYRGLAQSIAPNFPLAFPLLHGNPTSYSYDVPASRDTVTPVESELDGLSGGPVLSGKQATLVSAVQTQNNARVVWSGSLDLFSDAFATEGSGNAAFVEQVTSWLFQESGVLQVNNVKHAQVGSTTAPKEYRIRQEMTYSIELSQYKNDAWQSVDLDDVQLEVTMLDPHLRVPLRPTTKNTAKLATTYSTTVKLPDRHGVFSLLTDYKRAGWSFIERKDQITVTPLRHDEYPRFIAGAWPYYLSAISTSATFILFVGLYLGTDAMRSFSPSVKGKQKAQ